MRPTESQFQDWLFDTAARFGWRAWHVPMPVRPIAGGKFVPDVRGRGLPDIFLLRDRPAGFIVAELKAQGKTLRPDQRAFIETAEKVALDIRLTYQAALGPGHEREVPFHVCVWDWDDRDEIERLLR